jgi:hypothetical protein
MSPILFIGPFVAVVGLVAVFFVMRHKSVQTRSMYSSRRSNLERKVRAARTRTLGPEKHVDADEAHPKAHAEVAFEKSAFEGPPVAPPPKPMAAPNQTWDVGPTAAPPVPDYTPAPAPAAPEPPPPSEREAIWTPTPVEEAPAPAAKERTPAPAPVAVSAGAGASWSIVGGESKDAAISAPDGKKKKKGKGGVDTSAWELSAGEESADDVKKPSNALAIAQYAVFVVGLVMVLIGVMVMLANSHVT